MRKNRALHIILLVVVLNAITWMFWGRDSTLILAVNQFKTAGTNFVDTVYIFTGNHPNAPYHVAQYNDFSEKAHREMREAFSHKTTSLNIFPETYEEGKSELPEFLSYENGIFDFYIIRLIPFYAFVESSAIVGSGSADYSGNYIWFFRWWKLSERMTGVS